MSKQITLFGFLQLYGHHLPFQKGLANYLTFNWENITHRQHRLSLICNVLQEICNLSYYTWCTRYTCRDNPDKCGWMFWSGKHYMQSEYINFETKYSIKFYGTQTWHLRGNIYSVFQLQRTTDTYIVFINFTDMSHRFVYFIDTIYLSSLNTQTKYSLISRHRQCIHQLHKYGHSIYQLHMWQLMDISGHLISLPCRFKVGGFVIMQMMIMLKTAWNRNALSSNGMMKREMVMIVRIRVLLFCSLDLVTMCRPPVTLWVILG